jgi:hypothetical protein
MEAEPETVTTPDPASTSDTPSGNTASANPAGGNPAGGNPAGGKSITPRGRGWRDAIVYLGGFIVIVAFTAGLFSTYREGKEKLFAAEHSDEDPSLSIGVVLREVDTVKGELRMRVFVTPVGADAFERSYEIESANETAKEPLKIPKGATFASADVTVSFDSGEDLLYPFDRYKASFYVVAYEIEDSQRGPAVPAAFAVEASNAGYHFALSDDSEQEGLVSAVDITVTRAAVPIAVSITMCVLMLALGLIVVRAAQLIATGRRKFEFASLTWMAAMLFAFVGFRNAAPGSPVMGSLFDFMGFFWAELAVGFSLIRVGVFYVTRHRS